MSFEFVRWTYLTDWQEKAEDVIVMQPNEEGGVELAPRSPD